MLRNYYADCHQIRETSRKVQNVRVALKFFLYNASKSFPACTIVNLRMTHVFTPLISCNSFWLPLSPFIFAHMSDQGSVFLLPVRQGDDVRSSACPAARIQQCKYCEVNWLRRKTSLFHHNQTSSS